MPRLVGSVLGAGHGEIEVRNLPMRWRAGARGGCSAGGGSRRRARGERDRRRRPRRRARRRRTRRRDRETRRLGLWAGARDGHEHEVENLPMRWRADARGGRSAGGGSRRRARRERDRRCGLRRRARRRRTRRRGRETRRLGLRAGARVGRKHEGLAGARGDPRQATVADVALSRKVSCMRGS